MARTNRKAHAKTKVTAQSSPQMARQQLQQAQAAMSSQQPTAQAARSS